MTIGVLALQGAFAEHLAALRKLGVNSVEIRQRADFHADLDGIILPGGESTVMGKLLRELELYTPIRDAIAAGMPVFSTCAGLILLAERAENNEKTYFALMDITVRRNAYGRQLGSFRTTADIAGQQHRGHRRQTTQRRLCRWSGRRAVAPRQEHSIRRQHRPHPHHAHTGRITRTSRQQKNRLAARPQSPAAGGHSWYRRVDHSQFCLQRRLSPRRKTPSPNPVPRRPPAGLYLPGRPHRGNPHP